MSTQDEAARRVARMEQDATAALAQARSAGEIAAASASLGAKTIFSSLLLGLGTAMLGAWIGTRHARILAPLHEPLPDTHTTTYIIHTTYGPPPEPTSVHIYDETSHPAPAYAQDGTSPVTRQEPAERGAGEELRAGHATEARATP